jgi:hypothetical protein
MFLREPPTQTLKSVYADLDTKRERTVVSGTEIAIDMIGRDIGLNRTHVPLTTEGLVAIGNYCQVPEPFLKRCGDVEPQLQADILTRLLDHTDVAVYYTDYGIEELRDPTKEVIEPRRLVESLTHVLDPEAPVIEWFNSSQGFRVDTIVPEGFDRGIGGDRGTKRRVGDITRGGVRAGVDTKRGLAPWAQPYIYRLACTNGQECQDDNLAIDARGCTVDEVLAEFEQLAEEAFSQVESKISAFYDLRNEKVDIPERRLLRVQTETGLADRFVTDMQRLMASDEFPDEPSMFDIVNVITNKANDPALYSKVGTRRKLEIIGGGLISEHAARCGHCQSKLI